jgi:SAM-dependent methyltransferase
MPRSPSPRVQREQITREVADFYDKLVFPSRSSHPQYRDLLPGKSGERVGDFGCGQSLFYDTLQGYSPSPIFVDISRNVLGTIDHGHRICADLRHLPFRTACYDRIFCIGVLHHLPEREDVFRELARVILPGGNLFLGVYAPGTLNGRLRRLHDASGSRLWRKFVSGLTSFLIQVRHLMRGRVLSLDDVQKRAADFLEVPFVHYADPLEYVAEAEPMGLRSNGVRRISAMNIIEFKRI